MTQLKLLRVRNMLGMRIVWHHMRVGELMPLLGPCGSTLFLCGINECFVHVTHSRLSLVAHEQYS